MRDTLQNISEVIDPGIQNALIDLQQIADDLNIPVILVGATARDIIFEHIYQISAPRRTMDIDVAIRLENWDDYDRLTKQMLNTGKFSKDRELQRFIHHQTIIDLIPFGNISNPDQIIKWPPDNAIILNVMEYNQILDTATLVCISKSPVINIRVPSIPGLAILKLLSWHHGYPERAKDAQDFYFILNSYEFTDQIDRLFDNESQILSEQDFDKRAASIVILGKDMAQECDDSGRNIIADILAANTIDNSSYNLINQMVSPGIDFNKMLIDLNLLKTGFSSISTP